MDIGEIKITSAVLVEIDDRLRRAPCLGNRASCTHQRHQIRGDNDAAGWHGFKSIELSPGAEPIERSGMTLKRSLLRDLLLQTIPKQTQNLFGQLRFVMRT